MRRYLLDTNILIHYARQSSLYQQIEAIEKLSAADCMPIISAKTMQEEDKRRQELGLSEEEEAFYEILAQHKTAISDYALIKEIVKDVTVAVKKNLQIDWYKKPDAKAQILLSVKRVLMRKGVNHELQEILSEIMEQAEARYKEWWGVGT